MLLENLCIQGQTVLPLFTDLFSNDVPINSVTKTGDTVLVNAPGHGLSLNDLTIISGVKTDVQITNITTSDGTATATCSSIHDLTKNFTKQITISSPESAYDGTFDLLCLPSEVDGSPVDDTKTFQFSAPGTPTDSTGTLSTFQNLGLNGTQTVTNVVDLDNFEYELFNDNIVGGSGPNMRATKPNAVRVSAAASLPRLLKTYTKQDISDVWGYWVMGGSFISNDRSSVNDAISERNGAQDFKIRRIQNATFYVFINTKDQIAAAGAIDLGEKLLKPIYKTYARWITPSVFSNKQLSVLMPAGDGASEIVEDILSSHIVIGYDFQQVETILNEGFDPDPDQFMNNSGDTYPNFNTAAFRQANLKYRNEFDETIKDDLFRIPQDKDC